MKQLIQGQVITQGVADRLDELDPGEVILASFNGGWQVAWQKDTTGSWECSGASMRKASRHFQDATSVTWLSSEGHRPLSMDIETVTVTLAETLAALPKSAVLVDSYGDAWHYQADEASGIPTWRCTSRSSQIKRMDHGNFAAWLEAMKLKVYLLTDSLESTPL